MSLSIVRMQAENYKRLVAVDIVPSGNIVTISGRNAQGKTSVLDAIWAALAGGEASRATKQPIREGQDTAVVTLDLGDYVVTRRWTKDDAGTLTVETPPTADGRKQKYSSPQALIDGLLGKRAFDPLAFTRMSANDQVAALVATVELPFDPAVLDRERKGVFEQRTDINRSVAQLEGQLSGLRAPTQDLPTSEIAAADVIAEFNSARDHNAKLDAEVDRLASLQTSYENADHEVDKLRVALDAAITHAESAHMTYENAMTAFRSAPERIDTDAITAKLTGIESTNAAIRAGAEHRRVAAALATKREESAQFTLELQRIDKVKSDALAAVTFPVDGLSFDDTGVLFKGVPFSQASAAEQLRVSAALAMAQEPELRILQVRDGSLLDTESLAILEELATEREFQVWVERVDESGRVGIVIEDGQVAA